MRVRRKRSIENVSRRQFLGGVFSTGAFVLAARVMPEELLAQAPAARPFCSRVERTALHPSIYLGIEPDGTVFIVTHRSEMGTGIRTTLPLIAADELDADWSRVSIEQGIGDARYGDQNTDGSQVGSRFLRRVPRWRARRRGRCSCRPPPRSGTCRRRSARRSFTRWFTAERPRARLRRTGGSGRQSCRAARDPGAAQAEERVAVHRQGIPRLRPEGHRRPARRSSAWTRSAKAWCTRRSSVPRCSAATVRSIDDARALKVAGVRQTATHRSVQAAAPVPAARRRGGDWRQHVGASCRDGGS